MGIALRLEIIQAESLCKCGGGGFSKLKKKVTASLTEPHSAGKNDVAVTKGNWLVF